MIVGQRLTSDDHRMDDTGMPRELRSGRLMGWCFTILCTDDVPALQVLNSDGKWIQAPPVLSMLSSATVTIPASATLASCFSSASGVQRITFKWSSNRTSLLPTAAADTSLALLSLDAAAASLRDLRISGSSLTSGVLYTLQVSGCMEADPLICGVAETSLALRDQPLEGGVRAS